MSDVPPGRLPDEASLGPFSPLPLGAEVELLMLCPNDADTLDRLGDVVTAAALADAIERMGSDAPAIHPSAALWLARIPPPSSVAKDIALKRVHGRVAGWILNFVLAADANPKTRKFAHLTNAYRSVERAMSKERGFGAPNCKKIWLEYQKVSHLWAALFIWHHDLKREVDLTKLSKRELNSFLGIAASIRRRAMSLKPSRSRHGGILTEENSIELYIKGVELENSGLSYAGLSDDWFL